MARKRPQPASGNDSGHPGNKKPPTDAFSIRFDDPRLLQVLHGYADSQRRSTNLQIVMLLEEAMVEAGLWPPKPSP